MAEKKTKKKQAKKVKGKGEERDKDAVKRLSLTSPPPPRIIKV